MDYVRFLLLPICIGLSACAGNELPLTTPYTADNTDALLLIGVNSVGKPTPNWSGPELDSFKLQLNDRPESSSLTRRGTIADVWYKTQLAPKDGDKTKTVEYFIRPVAPGRVYVIYIEASKYVSPIMKEMRTVLSTEKRFLYIDAKPGTINYIGEFWVDPTVFPARFRIVRDDVRAKAFLHQYENITAPMATAPIKLGTGQ